MNFIENESATKLRGGYYTDLDIALFLTEWVLEISPARILEPSCGDGVFIESIRKSGKPFPKSIKAFEIDSVEAKKALSRATLLNNVTTDILEKDFIEWAYLKLPRPLNFDAVVGNPPFIRYQYLDDGHQVLMQKAFEYFKLPFTKHTNAWVAFVILSLAHLRAGGRLAMVVPSELLHVLHAQSLRDYLAEHCSKILIIDPEELWFTNALQGVVLLLAEKKEEGASKGQGIAITKVREREFLKGKPSAYFNSACYSNGEVVKGKWMSALLTQKERDLLKEVYKHPSVHKFEEIADVDVGIVTGANKFFLVSDEVIEEFGLSPWAHPMFGRSEHARGVVYDRKTHKENKKAGLPANFLWFDSTEITALPKKVQEYIRKGEEEGLHLRYKCRIRSPWYKVPSVYTSPVGMLKRCHGYPRLILNKAEAFTTDTAYRITVKGVVSEHLVFSFVNSLTALSAELEGRHYGGGVLELVPSEIERVLVPIAQPAPDSLERLDYEIRHGASADDVLLRQDSYVLKEIGLDKDERRTLNTAWARLRDRRQRVPTTPGEGE
jgi:adenine-specific DNA methylase